MAQVSWQCAPLTRVLIFATASAAAAAAVAYGLCAAANVHSRCVPAPAMMSLPMRLVPFSALAEASEQGQKAACNKNVYCLLFSKKQVLSALLARVSVCLCVYFYCVFARLTLLDGMACGVKQCLRDGQGFTHSQPSHRDSSALGRFSGGVGGTSVWR